MSGGMKPLRELEAFTDFTVSMSDHPMLGVVVGTVFTLIVQSSSATVGILQGLYAENLVDLKAALPILFGDNIGTTITAVLASIGASVAAKTCCRNTCIYLMLSEQSSSCYFLYLSLRMSSGYQESWHLKIKCKLHLHTDRSILPIQSSSSR